MSLTPEQREDVIAHIRDAAEANGVDIANPQELMDLMLDELTIDPVPDLDRAKRRELRILRQQLQPLRDRVQAVRDRITELEGELGP